METEEHTYLVAFTIEADARYTRAEVEVALHPHLTPPHTRLDAVGGVVDSWWVAEDDRQDRSDNDSAMFVPYRGPASSRSDLHEAEREELLEDFDGFGSELIERVQRIIAARYQP